MFNGVPYLQSTLAAATALVAWSLLIWIWMYAKRIPAMGKAKINPQDARFPGSLNVLPDDARQAADNYNHLMEQPTIFYAVAIIAYLAAQSNELTGALAWGYVGLRVLHSLLQVTINAVPIRFLLFSLSTLALMGLTVVVGMGAMG
ncbi:MAG: MAPEG family protein [Caulobacter sp.]|nr:MAPEG family protein [Caulobacter sp.]